MKIGLIVIATGKYVEFLPHFVESARKFFFHEYDVTINLFSDRESTVSDRTNSFFLAAKPWPYPTLRRYHAIHEQRKVLCSFDYLFYCDVDMRFVFPVGEEALPDSESGLVGTEHPGFFGGRRGTFERRIESTAYVPEDEGIHYFAGGFNGGTSAAFLNMSGLIKERVDHDLNNKIISVWHDESHLNRYFVDHPPKMLDPGYCYPESWNIPFKKRILALDKDHEYYRQL